MLPSLRLLPARSHDRRSFRKLVLRSALPLLGMTFIPVAIVATSGFGVLIVPLAVLSTIYALYCVVTLVLDARRSRTQSPGLFEGNGTLVRQSAPSPVWGRLVIPGDSVRFKKPGNRASETIVPADVIAQLRYLAFGLPPKRAAIYLELRDGERWAFRSTTAIRQLSNGRPDRSGPEK